MGSRDDRVIDVQELNEERAARVNDQLDGYLTEGAKASILLNSGAIVATLGFLQALAGKDLGHQFLPYGISAALLFALGAICSVATFHSRHRHLWEVWVRQSPAYVWTNLTYGLAALSLVCFATGVAAVLFGAASVYRQPSEPAHAVNAPAPANRASAPLVTASAASK